MSAGIGAPGLTSAENSAVGWPSLILTAASSVMLACSGSQPVVSTSTITKSTLARGRLGAALAGSV